MLQDSRERFGVLTKTLHWIITVLIFWQLLKLGDRIDDGEHWVGETLVPWHVSIGSLLFLLILARILWAVSQRGQRPLHDPKIERLVKVGHGLLYLCMLLMPLTGMMVMIGEGYAVEVFGMQLVPKSEGIPWAAAVGNLHPPLAWLLTLLILGHIGMAFIHHFVMRDDTLKRML